MSTSSTGSTTSTTTGGYTLSTLTGSSTPQVTGLSSGLNTDQIIEELMATKQEPLTNLENQQSLLNARNSELETIQSQLQTVQTDAMALLDPSLYDPTQTVTSSNSSSVGAALTGSTGAVEGGYAVSVTALAQSAQRTFTYSSPTSDDAITIDGQAVTIKAGETATSFAQAINNNSSLDVYATVTQSGNLVLSDRATGDQSVSNPDYISVVDGGGSLTEITADAQAGQDAAYSIGTGATQYSASDTVTDAIPGVTLTLSGVTGSSPATVNISAPTMSSSNVSTAVQQFITDYNTAITTIQTQLSTTPADTNGTETGTLYDDQDLKNLLSQMRSAMYATVSGISGGSLTSLLAVGVSTGATTGSGTESASSLAGDLTLDTTSLTNAITANPTGVQQLLGGWANSFSSLVGTEADAGGTITQRINGNTTEVSSLGNQITTMQANLTDQENQLVTQFAAMESALSSNSSESSWLTQQINAL
ncbi:MAG TPA: flagellar filament capping protein FliD [Solirubrobacteraceae bacterium]|nr:flagellar filament capping protein FliD [Solirubrobacteraceae bacterium]